MCGCFNGLCFAAATAMAFAMVSVCVAPVFNGVRHGFGGLHPPLFYVTPLGLCVI